ncbi:hypothetical protein IMZ29_03390 [Achromobacter sp. GG226]|uniref:tripartite tricarboxylate transporter substrate-binding protein n=1 Tax=Verticiella alkaliphila TaxID=2779529 RepID=UPI001C0DD9C1|nr:tripartite tricarboxylate transporter substrate-binding protein [Verticiella sp. GG226]MBU4609624.1 hypothetical protein [Verticiella sp. GG226]
MPLPSLRRIALTVALAATAVTPAHAAESVTRLIVGFQAGGGLDGVARALADALSRDGKRRVIVENRPGASGMIAIDNIRSAKPEDGVLIILPSGSITMTPHTHSTFRYDPERDLTPVARVATYALGMAVTPGTQVTDWASYLKQVRTDAALRTYGTAGVGLSPHYVGVEVGKAIGVDIVHVPYKGAGPAINDAVGGQIPMVISTVPSLLTMVRDQRLRLIATSGEKRDPNTPDVPTLRELGYDKLAVEEWFGVLAPAGLSADAAQQWNTEINAALQTPALQQVLKTQGFVPAPASLAEFTGLVQSDYRRWQQELKDTGDTFAN